MYVCWNHHIHTTFVTISKKYIQHTYIQTYKTFEHNCFYLHTYIPQFHFGGSVKMSPWTIWPCKNHGRMKHRKKIPGTKITPWTIWPCKNHAKMNIPSKIGMKELYVYKLYILVLVLKFLCMYDFRGPR